ncbi:PREDICTED: uncharacterized protein LOC108376608 [Rhagoletis zephyria]|uniref:uncharacterized protein LOC108360836 n=1 Tax=Rhagoletis zephyria TaxID=28612 RepID=UPI000811956D|nr:PREDICTED: uncharacterized protein LOC108360836 [Rhagoletis zephyria]XP_017488322.1 PREDICTED: uncharacterized protein LOC108376608 [Rhagoletis zephyria]XP_036318464.1 uncharacterized protein LOC118733247 [Rhagoletis pomonella]
MSLLAPAGAAAAAAANKDEEITVPKSDSFFESKTFRLISLMLYMGGISGLGMTLAMYYLFIWDSRMPPLPEYKHAHHVG